MSFKYDDYTTIRRSDDHGIGDIPDDLRESVLRRVTVVECPDCGNEFYLWVRSGMNCYPECDVCGNSGQI